jgi:hypothetical protein
MDIQTCFFTESSSVYNTFALFNCEPFNRRLLMLQKQPITITVKFTYKMNNDLKKVFG